MKIKVQEKHSTDLLKVNFLRVDEDRLILELNAAHEDYQKRKNEIITKLYTIWKNDEVPAVYRKWVRQAARFINKEDF